ncbi:MAG: hypothetical protein V1645_03445 [archaeon]
MGELVRLVNEQESFLRGIQREARAGNNAYELMAYPKGYVGVQQNVRDIIIVGQIVGKEVGYEGDNLGRAYQKARRFFSEKILGKKKHTIEELLDMQSRNIALLSTNLRNINEEAKEERTNIINYYEEICDEFRQNILTNPERQKKLRMKTQEFSTLRQKINGKRYDQEYFDIEKRFRETRRQQAEEEHEYTMRMRDTVKLEQEKGFLDIMEQLLTKSIHLSEMYTRESEYIQRHVERTKNAYIRLIRQQGQFFLLRNGVEKLKDYMVNLQKGVIRGISEMNMVVNGTDALNAVYAPNMGNLKAIIEDIRNAENERAIQMEKMLGGNKLLK